ncbi:hypothetical protein KC345_g9735 [Hortaea werneckii]|nr:hypothetical protein KC345_g9735 [Hortaea werneckii]
MKRVCGMIMAIILFVGMVNVPKAAHAADPTMEGHGLLGDFFQMKSSSDRYDISVFNFEEQNYRGERVVGNLNGDTFSGLFNQFSGTADYNTARFTGTIVPEYTEDYTFHMEGDDGFRLWVNGELILDFWKIEWEKPQTSRVISLEAGKHYEIKVEYFQGWGGTWLRMEWESLSQAREIVPESALYTPTERAIPAKKADLSTELQKAEYLTENFKASVTQSVYDQLNTSKITAAELLTSIDGMEIDGREKLDLLDGGTRLLSMARSDFMKGMGVLPSSISAKFNNPLYQGQDPFVTYHNGFYYFVSSSNLDSNNKVYVSKSRTLTDQGEKVMVFDSKGTQTRIFAPEIFFLEGKWYIYYCADLKDYGYKHMATVLESVTDDPQGMYTDKGALYAGENGEYKQANDFTVFDNNGQLYAVWGTLGAGEPIGPAIAPMDNPYTITADRSFLPGKGGEGPRVLQKDGKVFITMSDGDYQSDRYRLSYYMNTGGDFLNPDSWTHKENVFVSSNDVSGPARAGFVKSADGTEDWMIYHSRVYKGTERNSWRQVNIKKFDWNADGTPNFGTPVSPGRWQDLPSGDLGQGDMYQAEAAILYGEIGIDNTHKGYQGTGYINLPNKPGAEANFVVKAEEEGDYIVGVRYAYGVKVSGEYTEGSKVQLPGRAKINVYVNGTHVKTIEPDKTEISWDEWFTASERLRLAAGENVISYRIDTGSIGNVNLDYLTLYKADVPYSPVDKTALAAAIAAANAEAAKSNMYTSASITLFKAEIQAAQAVLSNRNAGQDQINNAATALQAAWNLLKLNNGGTVTVPPTDGTPPPADSTPPPTDSTVVPPANPAVVSTDGRLTLPAGGTGKVSLGEDVSISIPSQATDKELKLTIEKLSGSISVVPEQYTLASPVFEISTNPPASFIKPATLTLAFDSSLLKEGTRAAVFTFDETKKEWVELGGTVSGHYITVQTHHFSKYAVFTVAQPAAMILSDISGHWAAANIHKALDQGIAAGYPDGTFHPDGAVTRAEFSVMLVNALKLQEAEAALAFTDKAMIGDWAQKAVAQAVQAGFIHGYDDGSFRPNRDITRAEMARMVANALNLPKESAGGTGFADDNAIPLWAKSAVAELKKLGLVEGGGANKFVPAGKTTRAEAVTVLLKMLMQ